MKKLTAVTAVLLLAAMLIPSPVIAADVPVISSQPQNLRWPEGETAYYTVKAEGDPGHEKYVYQWYIIYDGVIYNASSWKASDPWIKYTDPYSGMGVGTVGSSFYISGIKSGLDGAEIYCIVKTPDNSAFEESAHAVIMVGPYTMFTPPEITVPSHVKCRQDEDVELTCEARCTSGNVGNYGDFLNYTWYQSYTGRLQDISAVNRGAETSAAFHPDTSVPGIYYYVCSVEDPGEGTMTNMSYSSVITLEVTEKEKVLSLGITRLPNKMEYRDGEDIDITGLEVTQTTNYGYKDLTWKDATGYTPARAKVTDDGLFTITVSFGDESVSFEAAVLKDKEDVPTDPEPEKKEGVPAYVYVLGFIGIVIIILLIILIIKLSKGKKQ